MMHRSNNLSAQDLRVCNRYPKNPLRILLTGASGFIGSSLRTFLQSAGHSVIRLVRGAKDPSADSIVWNPSKAEFKQEEFEGFDVIIHLAGAGIADHRWTANYKKLLFLSRCRDTWILSQILSRLERPPNVMICASATGYYGDRGSEELTEDSPAGKGFLADLCKQWEAATQAVQKRGVRVVHTRFGAVLGAKGGMLLKMLGLSRFRLAGKIGSGKQSLSWISIDDLTYSIYHCLNDQTIQGAVNLVAPNPVTQEEFIFLLAKKLKVSAFCHLPAFLVRLVMGEMGKELLLASQKVKPQKLIETGYTFCYPDLHIALTTSCSLSSRRDLFV